MVTTTEREAYLGFLVDKRKTLYESQSAMSQRTQIPLKTINFIESGVISPETSKARFHHYLDALKVDFVWFEEEFGIRLNIPEASRWRYAKGLGASTVADVPLLGVLQKVYNGKAMRPQESTVALPSIMLSNHPVDSVYLARVDGSTFVSAEAKATVKMGSLVLFAYVPGSAKRSRRGSIEPVPGDVVVLWVDRVSASVLVQYWPGQPAEVESFDGSRSITLTARETQDKVVGVYLGHWVPARR
jgi:hypothetical protein